MRRVANIGLLLHNFYGESKMSPEFRFGMEKPKITLEQKRAQKPHRETTVQFAGFRSSLLGYEYEAVNFPKFIANI